MKNCFVLGAGGHSRTVVSLLKKHKMYEIDCVYDIHPKSKTEIESILGVPVIGIGDTVDTLTQAQGVDCFLAIGENQKRFDWWQLMRDHSLSLPNLIAPSAIIHESVKLGSGNVVCENAYIGPESELADNTIVNTGAIIEHECKLDSHCHVGPGVVLAGRCSIGEMSFLGAGSTIIDKTSIASGTTIGAGATVVGDIHSQFGTFVGVPATRIK